jgi:magnesium-transporting ATPase (P-type)
MFAFVAVLMAGGWDWGTPPDAGLLAQASGAYFITVVAAQMGNALACRSSTLTIGHLGLFTNPMLIWSVLIALGIALAMVFIPPLASLLGQASPTAIGWAVAAVAPLVLLLVDAADKAWRLRRYGGSDSSPGGGTVGDATG